MNFFKQPDPAPKVELKVVTVSADDLEDLISRVVRSEMERLTNIGGGFEDELWNRKQTADFLGISQQTLAKLVLEERIPAQRSGRKYHFLKSQVVDYLKGRNN